MTDNEIIKALKCCVRECCLGCPYRGKCHLGNPMIKDALDLITRQQAEIEKLKENRDELWEIHCRDTERRLERIDEIDTLKKELKTAKSEAVKEFAERLKEEYAQGINWFGVKEHYFVNVEDIDNLVKEMGESNG